MARQHDPATHVRVAFFDGDRLTAIPTRASYRAAALAVLADAFEPGRRYPEPEVNELLGVHGPDHATLRRLLVDEGFLRRERGVYWRSPPSP